MQRIGIDWGGVPRWVVVLLVLLTFTAPPIAAQTTYTWSAVDSNSDWLIAANWTPPSGPPGVPGQSTTNLDVALFDTLGSTVVNGSTLDNGYSLGAIATTGNLGGALTVHFTGNNFFRLNGGHTVESFTNVAAAAQNGRDLIIQTTNMQLGFGRSGLDTTFYAGAGRTLVLSAENVTHFGTNVIKEGPGALIVGVVGEAAVTRELAGGALNINGGTVAAHHTLNVAAINVAPGASLQAGLSQGDTLGTNATITFQNNSGLKVLTNGTTVTQLQNATMTKGANDTFVVTLAGLNPSGTETFNPTGNFFQGNLTNFDPNGLYTPSAPGDFSVVGDGFIVTDWIIEVANNNELRLNSVTVTPIPEPATTLALGAFGLAALRLVRRRSKLAMESRDVTR
jgi:hypothetical protein